MKSYTDIEQSKKLVEILPLESADYFHAPDAGVVFTEPYQLNEGDETVITAYKGAIPCWSLAALEKVMPSFQSYKYHGQYHYEFIKDEWSNGPDYRTDSYDNPIDACYEMILKLHELNLL